MKKEDFKIPIDLERGRVVVFKGRVYEVDNKLIMATETTCNLTKKSFKGITVGATLKYNDGKIPVLGSKASWYIENCGEKLTVK